MNFTVCSRMYDAFSQLSKELAEKLWNEDPTEDDLKLYQVDILGLEETTLYRAAEFSPALRTLLEGKALPIVAATDGKPVRLLPHQKKILEWMENVAKEGKHYGISGGILKVDTGLGKTITSISEALLSASVSERSVSSLVVCQKTLMAEWKEKGFSTFFPHLLDTDRVLFYHQDFIGKEAFEKLTVEKLEGYDFVVTTYDILRCAIGRAKKETGGKKWYRHSEVLGANKGKCTAKQGPQLLFVRKWRRVIYDESQNLRNHKTLTFVAAMTLQAEVTWCLTATLVHNSSRDFWSQLTLCGYIGCSHRTWARAGMDRHYIDSQRLLSRVYSLTKKEAGIVLPEKTVEKVVVRMDKTAKEFMDHAFDKAAQAQNDSLARLCGYSCVLEWLTKMRQLNIAPTLLSKRVENILPDSTTKAGELLEWIKDRKGTAGYRSPKIRATVRKTKEALRQGKKVLVFSSFVGALTLFKEAVEHGCSGASVEMLTGKVKGKDRDAAIRRFRGTLTDTDKAEANVLCCTYGTGSVGLNLDCAQVVITIDFWWNNATHYQAYSRAHRMGQKKEVSVYNIIVSKSVDTLAQNVCDLKNDVVRTTTGYNRKPDQKIVKLCVSDFLRTKSA